MSVFDYLDYKKYLLDLIKSQKRAYGYRTRLAEAAGCGSSYLSQVLRSGLQISVEQGLRLARFWNLDSLETEYFIELVGYARAGNRDTRRHYESRLHRLSSERRKNSVPIAGMSELTDKQIMFAASWLHSAVRTLAQTREHGTAQTLSRRLSVSQPVIEAVLKELESAGLIEKAPGGRWTSTLGILRLRQGSLQNRWFQSQWLQRASERSLLPQADKEFPMAFAAIFNLTEEDLLEIRQAHSRFMEKVHAIKSRSKGGDDAYCVLAQVFPV